MRKTALCLGLMLSAAGCTHREAEDAARDVRGTSREAAQEGDSAARKAGRTAYKVADEVKDAAKKAGREIRDASREAAAGWKEQRAKEKAKDR